MAKCEGLTGEALERCRRQSFAEGVSTSRWIGLFSIVFGLLILWQPTFFAWLVAGFMILTAIFLLVARKFLIAGIFFFFGALIFLYPIIIMYAIAAMFVIAGLIVIASNFEETINIVIGIVLIVVGFVFFFYPEFATQIVGIVLLFAGFILLITGYEGFEEGFGKTSEWVRR